MKMNCFKNEVIKTNGNNFLQFQKSQKLLYEYIDLKKIIWKLQDVDKIKNLFLNDSQRIFFDLIPKPHLQEIRTNTLNKKKSVLGRENIKRNKPKNFHAKKLLENFENMKASSLEIDKKIVSYFDVNFLQDLIPRGNHYFFIFFKLI